MELPDTPPPTPLDSTSFDGSATSRLSKSTNVAREIVETERSYVESLEDIAKGYKTQIIDYIRFCGLPLDVEDAIALFGNVEDALEFSQNFLSELESCNFDPEKIAQTFVDNANGFYIYTVYCTNYPKAVAILSSCQGKPEITEFFKACQKKLNHSLPLGAFLIKPVQRILKYHLLLRDLVLSIQKERRKSMSIVEVALTTMSSIATHINEMKKQHEDAIHIQEIQAQLLGWDQDDLSLCGDLLLEDSLRVKGAKNERIIYLFDRLLLIVKRKGENLVYKGSIPTNKLTLTDLIIGEPLDFKVSELNNMSNAFTFRPFDLATKSRWTKVIKDLMVSFHTRSEGEKAKLSRRSATRKRTKSSSPGQVSSVAVNLSSSSKTESDEKPTPTEEETAPVSPPPLVTTVLSKSRESTPTQSKKTKLMISSSEEDFKIKPVDTKAETELSNDDDNDDDDDEVVGTSFVLNVGTAVTIKRSEEVQAVEEGVDSVDFPNESKNLDQPENLEGGSEEPTEEQKEQIQEANLVNEAPSQVKTEETEEISTASICAETQSEESSSVPLDHDYTISEEPKVAQPEIVQTYADVAKVPPLEKPAEQLSSTPAEEKPENVAMSLLQKTNTPLTPVVALEAEPAPVLPEENKSKDEDEWVTSSGRKSKSKSTEQKKLKQPAVAKQGSPRVKKKDAKKIKKEDASKEEKTADKTKKEDHQKEEAPVVTDTTSTLKKRVKEGDKDDEGVTKAAQSEETKNEKEKKEEEKVTFSPRSGRQSSSSCPYLHLILVCIALTMSLLFAFLSEYPLQIKVGLVCLPSAALLLFLCAGERRREPKLLS